MQARLRPLRPAALLLLASASRALAQEPLCEDVYPHPDTGQPTTLSVLISSPLPGSEVRGFAPGCPTEIEVEGIASTVGVPPLFDFYLVIDHSGSTMSSSGVDIDGDGLPDSIIDAEMMAATTFVEALNLAHSRVAVIYFSQNAFVAQSLTSDLGLLQLALQPPTYGGSTNYGAAMIAALIEHGLNHDPARNQVILFLSDGEPNMGSQLPPGVLGCIDFPDHSCAGIAWAEEAGNGGIIVNTFAVGVEASGEVLEEMALRGNGQFFAIDVPGEVIYILPQVIHVGVRDVVLTNETTGTQIVVIPTPDGRFLGSLPLADGLNEIRVVARALEVTEWETTCFTDVTATCIAWSCPPPVVAECTEHSVVAGLSAWASDPDVSIEHDSSHADAPGADASGAYPLGHVDVTWTFQDDVAGTVTCASSVTLTDTQPPVFADAPAGGVFSCTDPTPAPPVVSDACDPSPTIVFEELVTPGDCPDRYEILRRWTATDASGLVSESEQHVLVTDDEPPSLDGVPASSAEVACDAVPPMPVVTAVDQCDPSPILIAEEVRIDGPCASTYQLVRTWHAEDRCGNAVEASQAVSVLDDQAPILVGPDDQSADCSSVPPIPEVTATDTCSTPTVTFVERLIPGTCPGNYELEREWTATDDCGNSAQVVQIVTVTDTTPPIIVADATHVVCLWPPNHSGHVVDADDFGLSVTDDCSGPVTWTFTECVSDQPDDGLGDGSTTGDCVISADGQSLLVRAERQGRGPGRHVGRRYSVAVIATDACGNVTPPTAAGVIAVPHDRSKHDETCGG